MVRLPIADPIARGYQYFAFPLAILATDPRTSDWVLSNYIQVEVDNRGWETDVPFSFCLHDYATSPWLEVVRGSRLWYSSVDICNTIRHGLGKGYYAYLIVDEYHVPRRRACGICRMPHDILVHGFDDRSGSFTVLGYDERMHFTSTQISGSDFEKAYTALDDAGMENAPVLFYRLRAEDQPDFGYPPIEYGLNLSLIRQTLDEYLRSVNSRLHFQMLSSPLPFMVTGVDTYEYLEEFIRLYAARTIGYDIRHLHILWEHKRVMAARIRRLADFLGPLGPFEAEARRIEDAASDLRNWMMRDHLQGGRSGYLDSSLRLLHEVRDAEVALFFGLLRRIDDMDGAALAEARRALKRRQVTRELSE